MFGLREIFPKLRLGDVEELDGCVVVLPTMGHLHGELKIEMLPTNLSNSGLSFSADG
jgi:hypothetical protein